MAEHEVDFAFENETRNKVRFLERPATGEPYKVQWLYVGKDVWASMGSPDRVTITIRATP